MKKLLLFAGVLLLIPFVGNGQFKEKHNNGSAPKPSNSDTSKNNSNNNNNNSKKSGGGNKPQPAENAKFNGDYDAPEAFTASFEDGSNIDYTLSNRNPDKIARLTVWIPSNFNFSVTSSPNGPSAPLGLVNWDLIGASWYQPDIFYLETNIGFTPVDFDVNGMIFFKEWSKVGQMKVVLKSTASGNVRTNYVSKVDMPAKAYLGVHLGFGIRNWGNVTNSSNVTSTYTDPNTFQSVTVTDGLSESYTYNTPQITVGLGYMGILHYTMFTSNNNRTRTTSIQSAMYLDALLYPSATISNFNGTFTYDNGFLPVTTTITAPTTAFKPGLVQGRFYFETKMSHVKGNYEWGWLYRFGGATNPFGYFYLFGTYGVYFKLM